MCLLLAFKNYLCIPRYYLRTYSYISTQTVLRYILEFFLSCSFGSARLKCQKNLPKKFISRNTIISIMMFKAKIIHFIFLTYVLGILSQNQEKISNLGKFASKDDEINAYWVGKMEKYLMQNLIFFPFFFFMYQLRKKSR